MTATERLAAAARARGLDVAAVYRVAVDDVVRDLAGRDLACWCPLDQPCHADVLLDLANR